MAIGISLSAMLAWSTRMFHPHTLVLKGLACTCPDFQVVQGAWKIQSPILDTVTHLDKSEVYVLGHENPWLEDPATMYDFSVAESYVVGIDRVSEGDPWNPVVRVEHWEPLGPWLTIGYGVLKWGSILFSILGLWMVVAKRFGY